MPCHVIFMWYRSPPVKLRRQDSQGARAGLVLDNSLEVSTYLYICITNNWTLLIFLVCQTASFTREWLFSSGIHIRHTVYTTYMILLLKVMKYALNRIPSLSEFCVICDERHVLETGLLRVRLYCVCTIIFFLSLSLSLVFVQENSVYLHSKHLVSWPMLLRVSLQMLT